MKEFLKLFTRNWGIKILALVLALVTYFLMKDSLRNQRHNPSIFLKGTADGQSSTPSANR